MSECVTPNIRWLVLMERRLNIKQPTRLAVPWINDPSYRAINRRPHTSWAGRQLQTIELDTNPEVDEYFRTALPRSSKSSSGSQPASLIRIKRQRRRTIS